MEHRALDLGVVSDVKAEAFGSPGERTFRLLAETASGSISLWLEKEQLAMVGSAVDEVLRRVPQTYGESPDEGGGQEFVGELEVRVGSLAIGYDADREGFMIEAGEFVSPFALESIRFVARRPEFARLREAIPEIVAAGRRRCPLCGQPLTDEPHFCPPSNGHRKLDA